MVIALPPVHEQLSICKMLSTNRNRLDILITKTERSIELLKERRSALITAAVTGQIDLREAV
jgi:type I restriction enzyme S subunit